MIATLTMLLMVMVHAQNAIANPLLGGGTNAILVPTIDLNKNNSISSSWRLFSGGGTFFSTKQQALSSFAASPLAALSVADLNAAATDSRPGGSGNTAAGATLRAAFDGWAAAFASSDVLLPSFASAAQRQTAFQNFASNMIEIKRVNSDPTSPYWLAPNQYSGLSFSDFSQRFLMDTSVIGDAPPSNQGGEEAFVPPSARPTLGGGRKLLSQGGGGRELLQTAPSKKVNWVAAGKVTPVKAQGSCGSCWAFAATAAIESLYMIAKNGVDPATLNLSEQQLVSCVNRANGFSGAGCGGGWSDQAFAYVARVNQTTEARYPYSGVTGVCNQNLVKGSAQAVKLSGNTRRVRSRNEAALMAAVASSPAVVYFNVEASFMSYAGGVYSPKTCGTAVNHAMVAVGFDASVSTARSWTLRNSWGPAWGEQGYARVKMTGNGAGLCGMYQYAYLPPAKFV